MSDWRETVLCALLDCGTADLSLLDDVDVDIYDVIEECRSEFGDTNINSVVRLIFDEGIRAVESVLDYRVRELEEIEEPSKAEEEELDALRECEPFSDIQSYHNYLDTSVWFEDHYSTYVTYLPDAIKEFERITGFSFSNI